MKMIIQNRMLCIIVIRHLRSMIVRKIFPSNHTIKQQQAIPAHLNASDEELCLFLQNPPSPPIPFYPSSVSFKSDRKNVKKQRKKSKKRRFEEENNAYFAAPNEINEVTVTYSMSEEKKEKFEVNEDKKVKKEEKNLSSLSISDDNHMKYVKKMKKQSLLSENSEKSMAAINDAAQSSLLENVDLTTSQTLNNEHLSSECEEDNLMRGNFANLSIDNDD